MSSRIAVASLAVVLALAGCNSGGTTSDRVAPDAGTGTDSGTPGTDSGTPGTDSGTPGTDAGVHPLETLISGTWSLPPGTESYKCVRLTLAHAIDVHRFHPIIPMGTHHTVLSVDPTGTMPDGVSDCSGFTNGPFMLFGSGLGTGDLTMPDGIAVHVDAGQQIVLNLHLFNLDTSHTLDGTSEIQIEQMDASAVVNRAEIFLAGIDSGLVVPGHMESTAHGTCSPSTGHLFAVFPHMHQTGTRITLEMQRSGMSNWDMVAEVPMQMSLSDSASIEASVSR